MIIFRNKGLIDPRAITTFGVSSKESENPIGQFGTGLKYAIAIILRNGGSITIWRGAEALEFSTVTSQIRVGTFELVTMNGRELGFTTQLGLHWEPWMAFRELYCNTMDEGGSISPTDTEVEGEEDHTTIVVSGAEFDKNYRERERIVLTSQPLFVLPGVEVHAGSSDSIFYRGIRVMKLNKRSLYTYNLTGYQTLTEDRTLAYPVVVPGKIAKGAVRATSAPFLTDILTAGDKSFEASLDWSDAGDTTPSDQFMAIASDLKARDMLKAPGANKLFGRYAQRISGYSEAYVVRLTPIEEHTIERALHLLDETGLEARHFQIVIKSTLPGKLASVMQGSVIEIAHRVIHKGEVIVARAILWGIARSFGGMVEDRLAEFILTKKMTRVGPGEPEPMQFGADADDPDEQEAA